MGIKCTDAYGTQEILADGLRDFKRNPRGLILHHKNVKLKQVAGSIPAGAKWSVFSEASRPRV